MSKICESTVEQFVLELLEDQGYEYLYGPTIAPDGKSPERERFSDVVLIERLKNAITSFNPSVPADAKEHALRDVLNVIGPGLIEGNESFHRMFTEGVDVEYMAEHGVKGDKIWLFDFKDVKNNEFIVCNQFTVIQNNINNRPDIVLFVNGLPLVVIELKNPADENATVKKAYTQIQNYKKVIPNLF